MPNSAPPDISEPVSYFELEQRRPGSSPVLGSGTRADHLPPPLRPDDQPLTYFELQRRGLGSDPDLSLETSADLPPLPSSSPWAGDQLPESTINREEDGDVMGTPIDQLP